MENKRYDQLSSAAISKNYQFANMLRKSQLKQSELIMQVCCSRHNHCIGDQCSPKNQNDSLSFNSDLLQEIEPKDVSSEPLFQYQNKHEIDMLAKINTKKKKYQKMMEMYEKELRQQERRDKIEKVKKQAQMALEHSKKVPNTKKAKWGHSIFELKAEEKEETVKQQQRKNEKQDKSKEKKKIEMKDIHQRIAQYKQEELKKAKSVENIKRPLRQDVNVADCKQKIKQNADKIMQKMKLEKDKVLQEKKLVQAKIRALQLQSLKKIQNCKKKPFKEGEFDLGDSQYSTFEARAAGRKLEKKKKVKQKLPEPSLLQTKKSKPSRPSSKRSKSAKKDAQNTVPRNKAELQKETIEQDKDQKEQIKGPFYVWNMPIMPEDIQKLDKQSKDVFMNVDRFNYKHGKTFREQANEYLAQRMEKKFQQARTEAKQHMFFVEVERKKKQLEQQFIKENPPVLNEPIWNEDELFRPNILENFHFFPKEAS